VRGKGMLSRIRDRSSQGVLEFTWDVREAI
jgi:hypothetical protein